MKTSYKRNETDTDNDRLWIYKWLVIIGVLIIMFFWTTIADSQSGIEYYKIITTKNLAKSISKLKF